MENLILFLNSFVDYLSTYIVFIVAIIIAFVIGTNIRKKKNAAAQNTEVTE